MADYESKNINQKELEDIETQVQKIFELVKINIINLVRSAI